MPMAKPLRQGGPFAAALGDVEDRVDDRESFRARHCRAGEARNRSIRAVRSALISMPPAYQPSATTF